jgi:hypothetical protein
MSAVSLLPASPPPVLAPSRAEPSPGLIVILLGAFTALILRLEHKSLARRCAAFTGR